MLKKLHAESVTIVRSRIPRQMTPRHATRDTRSKSDLPIGMIYFIKPNNSLKAKEMRRRYLWQSCVRSDSQWKNND